VTSKDVLKAGETFEMTCHSEKPIESCSFKFSGLTMSFKIQDGAKKDDYEYLGSGFQNGDCGLRFFNVKKEQDGNVTCTVSYPDIDYESIGRANLIIATPPTSVDLSASDKYKEGDEMNFRCTASQGRPAPTITLSLGKFTFMNSELLDILLPAL